MNQSALRVASYNLWFHRAYPEVNDLADSQNLDILCLQECFTDELQQKAGSLALAEAHTYANNPPPMRPDSKRMSRGRILSGNIGIALYYNRKRLRLEDITNYQLPLPWQERKGGRTLQLASFTDRSNNQSLIVGNIHLSALWAHNRSRRKQMVAALSHIREYQDDIPTVIAGDFNYPVVARGLRNLMAIYGFAECGVRDTKRTHTSKLVKGKFDRIFISKHLQELDYATLPFGASDHAPVMAEVTTGKSTTS